MMHHCSSGLPEEHCFPKWCLTALSLGFSCEESTMHVSFLKALFFLELAIVQSALWQYQRCTKKTEVVIGRSKNDG